MENILWEDRKRWSLIRDFGRCFCAPHWLIPAAEVFISSIPLISLGLIKTQKQLEYAIEKIANSENEMALRLNCRHLFLSNFMIWFCSYITLMFLLIIRPHHVHFSHQLCGLDTICVYSELRVKYDASIGIKIWVSYYRLPWLFIYSVF